MFKHKVITIAVFSGVCGVSAGVVFTRLGNDEAGGPSDGPGSLYGHGTVQRDRSHSPRSGHTTSPYQRLLERVLPVSVQELVL